MHKTKKWVVSRLLAIRHDPSTKRKQVLVRWRGFNSSADTWEPWNNLMEDGFSKELGNLVKSSKLTRRYVLKVRFNNVSKDKGIYKRLSAFLCRVTRDSNSRTCHQPGNWGFIFEADSLQLARLASEFKQWLLRNDKIHCEHAMLMRLATGTDAILNLTT